MPRRKSQDVGEWWKAHRYLRASTMSRREVEWKVVYKSRERKENLEDDDRIYKDMLL